MYIWIYYICIMELRIKDVVKAKGLTLTIVAKRMGLSPQALNERLNSNMSKKLIQEVADAIECSVFELIVPDQNLAHFYDENGEYHGVIRKCR